MKQEPRRERLDMLVEMFGMCNLVRHREGFETQLLNHALLDVLNHPGAADDGCLQSGRARGPPLLQSQAPFLACKGGQMPGQPGDCARGISGKFGLYPGAVGHLSLLSTSFRKRSRSMTCSSSPPASFLGVVAFAQPQPGRFSAGRSI